MAVLAAFAIKEMFAISDLAFGLFVLAGTGCVALFHLDSRLAVVESRVIHKDYSHIRETIEVGLPRTPDHQLPASAKGKGATYHFKESNQILFDDLKWLGAALNRDFPESWTVEEVADTEVRGRSMEYPEYGRRYRVFYNELQIGTLQITTSGDYAILQTEKFANNREAEAYVDLDHLRFVPFDDAKHFLAVIVLYVWPFSTREEAYAKALAEATLALTGHLWETVRIPDRDIRFSYQTRGPYELVRMLTDHWSKSGFDPLAEKSGGR